MTLEHRYLICTLLEPRFGEGQGAPISSNHTAISGHTSGTEDGSRAERALLGTEQECRPVPEIGTSSSHVRKVEAM